MTNLRCQIPLILPLFSTSRYYHIGTAQLVHSAIRRGLLKSRGLAFRGKSKPEPNDPRELYKRTHKLPDYSHQISPRTYNDGPGSQRKFHHKQQERNPSQPWLVRGKVNKKSPPAYESDTGLSKKHKPSKSRARKGLKTESLRRTMENDMAREGVLDEQESRSPYDNTPSYKLNDHDDDVEVDDDKNKRFGSIENSKSERVSTQAGYQEDSAMQEIAQAFNFEDTPFLNRKARRDAEFRKNKRPKMSKRRINESNLASQASGNESETPFPEQLGSTEQPKNLESFDFSNSRSESFSRPIKMPIPVPHTTSASEFIYGSSVINAALRSSREPRRQLYKLYIYSGINREGIEQDKALEMLAESKGVKVKRVDRDWLRVLDKMSNGRPHNGYILEASPLPRLPVTGLGEVITRDDVKNDEKKLGFKVQLDHQLREEAAINGTSDFVPCTNMIASKQPLVLLLDNIVDPGNLGGIIRAASFLGVTAVAISVHGCAPLSPVALKASAGASESMTLLSVQDPAEFLLNSKKEGWFIYASVPPSSGTRSSKCQHISLDELATLDSIGNLPSIIMIGGEGEGLRRSLRNKANVEIYIPGYQDLGVDCLNVTVATGIICNALRQIYQSKQAVSHESEREVSQSLEQGKEKLLTQEEGESMF